MKIYQESYWCPQLCQSLVRLQEKAEEKKSNKNKDSQGNKKIIRNSFLVHTQPPKGRNKLRIFSNSLQLKVFFLKKCQN